MRHPPRDRNNEICDGPLEKRSPALVVSKRRANRKSGPHSQAKNTNIEAATQAPERRSFCITSGRDALGWVEQTGREFEATAAPDHRTLGIYATLKAAADAIWNARDNINSHDGGVR